MTQEINSYDVLIVTDVKEVKLSEDVDTFEQKLNIRTKQDEHLCIKLDYRMLEKALRSYKINKAS